MFKHSYRISAIFFALWGLVHVAGGGAMYFAASSGDAAGFMSMVSSIPQQDLATREGGYSAATLGVFAFHGYNLAWIGALVLVIAVARNWRRHNGFLLNTALVVLTDLGLLITSVSTGIMRATDASPGFGLAAVATLFAAIAMLARRSTPQTRP